MEPDDPDLAGLRSDLRAILEPDAAFLMAADAGARHDPGIGLAAQVSGWLYTVMVAGFASAFLQEVAKGALKDTGKALGQGAWEWLQSWGRPPAASAAEADPAALKAADDGLRAAGAEIEAHYLDVFLASGEAAVVAELAAGGFPPRKAKRVARGMRDLARRRVVSP